MVNKIDKVLNEVLKDIIPTKETMAYMQEELALFLKSINARIKKLDIKVEPFVGGSFAKDTLMKKGSYDVDLFMRFDKKYPEATFTKLIKKILSKTKKVSIVHGSRDYFQVKINPWFKIEVVPVRKVNKPKEAENITDLSYSHVKYINKKIKSKKILDDIKIAKAFAHATKTYGAESYVHGFSGYALELLVYHYKSFEKMLKELSKKTKDKIIVDTEKQYKNKREVMFEMNGSKLMSPIILIDPTFKERNALAALSDETFERFKIAAKAFLKKPTKEAFIEKRVDLDELKIKTEKEGKEFVLIKTKTKKQNGDIAGTKLLKFHRHLIHELKRYFEVEDSGFKYEEGQEGKGYFIIKKKEYEVFAGPMEDDTKNLEKFKAQHKNIYEENGRVFAKEKNNFTIKEFFKGWSKKNKKKIKQMYISKIKVI
ncbi:MAG: nucleotidyltransferase domain-containing protein [Nanoarchaeota archaeon]|jgi:tRNA nucleotidyltransferase (CCA-adding enzyme)|nr:nucleotidyltransferase domain-containing protein [Nanoarchaeota archaeon]